jgi:hypothetical protein
MTYDKYEKLMERAQIEGTILLAEMLLKMREECENEVK